MVVAQMRKFVMFLVLTSFQTRVINQYEGPSSNVSLRRYGRWRRPIVLKDSRTMAQIANSVFPPCQRRHRLAWQDFHSDAGLQVPKQGSRPFLVHFGRSVVFIHFGRSIVLTHLEARHY